MGDIGSDGACLPSQVIIACDGALVSWRWLSTCLPMECGEGVLSFSLLTHMALALPRKLSVCQTMSFPQFYPYDSLPYLTESKWLCGGQLPLELKLGWEQ